MLVLWLCRAGKRRSGAVRRAVVNGNELGPDSVGIEKLRRFRDICLYGVRKVVDRHDDGEPAAAYRVARDGPLGLKLRPGAFGHAVASNHFPWRRICRVTGGSITSPMSTSPFSAVLAAVWRRMIHICTIEKRFERNQ